MSRGRVLGLVAVLAVVVAVALWAAGGPGTIFGSRAGGAAGGGGDDADASGAGAAPAEAGTAAGGTTASRHAVLFGRPRAERRGVSAVLGRVVRAKDHTPVQGATAMLTGEGNGGEKVSPRVVTDERGTFVLTGVPSGDDYTLRVEPAGEPGAAVTGVALAAGETRDLGTILVGAAGRLSGRVVDPAGAGVAGAEVRLHAGYASLLDVMGDFVSILGSLDRDPTPLAKTTTDAAGRFELEDASPGPVVVIARAPGRRQAMRDSHVTAEGFAGGPITLVLEPGAVVAGTVVDGEGHGVPRARLGIMSEGTGGPADMMYGRVVTEADERGAWAASVGAESAKLRAFAAAEGYPTAFSGEFRAGDRDVRITLSRGATVEVAVVSKEGRRPLAGEQVLLGTSDGKSMDEPEASGGLLSGTTDADGLVTFQARPGAIQMLMVAGPFGGGMVMAQSGVPSTQGLEVDPLPALEAGKTHRVTVRVDETVTLVGRVTDPDGRPIAGASVSVFGAVFGSRSKALSGADGSYRLDGVSLESTLILLRAPGWVQRGYDSVKDDKENLGADRVVKKDFTMQPAATVTGRVVTEEGVPVAGAEVRWNGESGSYGFAEMTGGGGKAYTGVDGAYVLYDVDAGGDAKDAPLEATPAGAPQVEKEKEKEKGGSVVATADGFVKGRTSPFRVPAGGRARAPDVVLARGATVRGVVLAADGRPASGARLEVATNETLNDLMLAYSGRETRHATAGADGSFVLENIPDGDATVTAHHEGAAPTRKTVKVEGGKAAAPVEIRMRRAGEVKGRVLGPDGKPVADARVSVSGSLVGGGDGDDAWVSPVRARTGEDGAFRLEGLPPGRVEVEASAEGQRPASAEAVVGGSVEIRLVAAGAGDAARLAEVKAEIVKVATEMQAAKSSAERDRLLERLQALSREQQQLEKGAPSDDDEPAPPSQPR
jgi:protocatechuate 3,4-dioxygenase beta subunit